ncbi:MAG: hypothetical protein AVDCRST_MAG70-1884 [uncultured Thermomicrobiales bacterium]|uniref:Uncharacterized protein n=1 Tax=uncultured Thermomicrobiales bacterium TaxID=1645740 RepID=A0A6J4V159_9BACT|nr:MAG: hypothetical protein AVDCRST_MAG70-1884 [uncultured Thermomicrobiales bacterium]
MRPTYATRLTVEPRPGDSRGQFLDRVVAVSEDWIRAVAVRHRLDVPVTGAVRRARNTGQSPSIEIVSSEDAVRRAWRALVRTPLGPGHPLEWPPVSEQVEIAIPGRDGDRAAVVTVRAAVGSSSGVVVPVPVEGKTPRVVAHYARDFAVRCGAETIESTPWVVDSPDVVELRDRLLAPDRMIPIIIVTPDLDGVPPVNVALVSRTMLGLARVVAVAPGADSDALSERLPGALTPVPGSVRLYWPCLDPGEDPLRHPVWTRDDLAAEDVGRRFDRVVFRLVAGIAAVHIGRDWEVEAIERAVERQRAGNRDAEVEELRAARHARDAAAARLEALGAELARARDEAEENARLYDLVERERAGLREETYQLQAKLRGMIVDPVTVGLASGVAADDAVPATLADAVRDAVARFGGPHIVVLPDAIEAAEEGSYSGGMQKPFEMLRGICEVARAYHDGTLNETFEVAFQSRGFSYRGNVSVTARGLYRDDYRFMWDNGRYQQPITVGPHLALGKGNPNNSLRMYWYVDTDERRFVLCHVGKHLPDTTT